AAEKLRHDISLHRRVLLENFVRSWAWYFYPPSSEDSSSEDSSSDDDDSSSDDNVEDGDESAVPAPTDSSENQNVSNNPSPFVSEDGAGPPK
ncbi:hypothetical protein MRX96_054082, partial [Rhipicephalus microplus]